MSFMWANAEAKRTIYSLVSGLDGNKPLTKIILLVSDYRIEISSRTMGPSKDKP